MLGPSLRLCVIPLWEVVVQWVEAVVAMPCLVVDVVVETVSVSKICAVDEYSRRALRREISE